MDAAAKPNTKSADVTDSTDTETDNYEGPERRVYPILEEDPEPTYSISDELEAIENRDERRAHARHYIEDLNFQRFRGY